MTTETNPISNDDDIIDSRDVTARIEQLRAIREPGPVLEGVLNDEDYSTDQDALFNELAVLESLDAQGQDAGGDWAHGATLVRDSYFVEYAQELAEDIGAINTEIGWPNSYIDWERAADALRMDYTPVEFDGITYWVR